MKRKIRLMFPVIAGGVFLGLMTNSCGGDNTATTESTDKDDKVEEEVVAVAELQCYPYLDQDGVECVLTSNSGTGSSDLFFYDSEEEVFTLSPYQLQSNLMGASANTRFAPYLDQDGYECVMIWDELTGKSKLYYYSDVTEGFVLSEYQLPENPTGDKGKFYFAPYLDQDGVECVLVTNIVTGSTKLYYYAADEKAFAESPYQLPANLTEDEGSYYCIPYIDMDGIECVLAYNSTTGKSILYYYDTEAEAFSKSPYQLDKKPTGDEGEYHFRPYLDQDGIECVLAYNSKTTKSVLFYYDSDEAAFLEAPYQMPNDPTGDKGNVHFQPYIDMDGIECVLTWNTETGSSKLYYYDSSTELFEESPYQLADLE